MDFDGAYADAELEGDGLVRVSVYQCLENLPLARAEHIDQRYGIDDFVGPDVLRDALQRCSIAAIKASSP